MEARLRSGVLVWLLLVVSMGASHRTANFIVSARDAGFARQMGEAAETLRKDLALSWLGRELPRWSQPCPIAVTDGPRLGAGGATSFMFSGGEVYGWKMEIQGSRERLLDSVLPHEVTHTIFATHFRQPLPRWADEGGASTVEHLSERQKHQHNLVNFLTTGRGIRFSDMFQMREYPADILPLYAQGYSLARFLIERGGRRKYVEFVGQGLAGGRWEQALRVHYGFPNLVVLQDTWLTWIRQGSPTQPLEPGPAGEATQVADWQPRPRPAANLIYHVDEPSAGAGQPLAAPPADLAGGPSAVQTWTPDDSRGIEPLVQRAETTRRDADAEIPGGRRIASPPYGGLASQSRRPWRPAGTSSLPPADRVATQDSLGRPPLAAPADMREHTLADPTLRYDPARHDDRILRR